MVGAIIFIPSFIEMSVLSYINVSCTANEDDPNMYVG